MKIKRFAERFFGQVALGTLLLSLSLAVPAWGKSLEWVTQAGGSVSDVASTATDLAESIAVTQAGNSYVTGRFIGMATFGAGESNETELTSSGDNDSDIFVAKYAEDGSLRWAIQAGGEGGFDTGSSIAVDPSGNSYVTGDYSDGSPAVFGRGEANETVLVASGHTNIFVAKYGKEGNLLWARPVEGRESDTLNSFGIGIDESGNSYVTGSFMGIATFGPGEAHETELTSSAREDDLVSMFLAKYDPEGKLLWATQTGGKSANVTGSGISVDEAGTSYVTGSFTGAVIFGPGEANETELTDGAIFIAKYNSDGRLIWVSQVRRNLGSASGSSIAIDQAGGSYITGNFRGTVTFGPGEVNETVLSSDFFDDAFVASYDPDGRLLWVSQAGGSTDDGGRGIALDSENNSYVTGFFSETAIFGAGETNETTLLSFGANDIFVAKYDKDGSLLRAFQAGGSGSDLGNGIALDSENKSYVAGLFNGTATFGDGEANETTLVSLGGSDLFVAKYSIISTGDTIQNLIDLVEGFDLNRGIERSLIAKLRNAQKSIDSPNASKRRNAANLLEAFINEVEAQSGKHLTEDQADQLIDLADQILDEL